MTFTRYLAAAAPDLSAKAYNLITMSLSKAFRCADAATFNEGADNGGLSIERGNVDRGQSKG
jgi:hypothetical protein